MAPVPGAGNLRTDSMRLALLDTKPVHTVAFALPRKFL